MEMWLDLAGVYTVAVAEIVWQLPQAVAPLWFIKVPGPHCVPIPWQVPQLVLFIGATVCGLVRLTPATGGFCPAIE